MFEEDGYRRLLKSLRLRAEQIGAAKVSTQAESISLPDIQKDTLVEIGGDASRLRTKASRKGERDRSQRGRNEEPEILAETGEKALSQGCQDKCSKKPTIALVFFCALLFHKLRGHLLLL
ncbi:MAG: hypothetical protein IPO22_06285 [Anaerolineales bacterium]|nr:hypothetical protein [Anaerolineales bacterium]